METDYYTIGRGFESRPVVQRPLPAVDVLRTFSGKPGTAVFLD